MKLTSTKVQTVHIIINDIRSGKKQKTQKTAKFCINIAHPNAKPC